MRVKLGRNHKAQAQRGTESAATELESAHASNTRRRRVRADVDESRERIDESELPATHEAAAAPTSADADDEMPPLEPSTMIRTARARNELTFRTRK